MLGVPYADLHVQAFFAFIYNAVNYFKCMNRDLTIQ